MNWINVKDKLPEINNPVLVIDKNNFMITGYYFYDGSIYLWILNEHYENRMHEEDITHWMPLPEPPKD